MHGQQNIKFNKITIHVIKNPKIPLNYYIEIQIYNTKVRKNSIYTLTTKIFHPTRIKNKYRPITYLHRTKRNSTSRKKGINHIEPTLPWQLWK